ncbi:hypothetical protein BMS3Abin04_01230 [bacterium BMS3Abin04]|nr:hypothetical protein BMS3Abin04_01230 [bacterium BMS3Abin04]
MKIKSSQMFWGFSFLTVGVLYLLEKLDVYWGYWGFIWDLWPLILILAGIAIIVKGTFLKPLISGLFGILVGVLVFGFFNNLFTDGDYNRDDFMSDSAVKRFNIEYSDSIKYANLNISDGAGRITIKDTTSQLVEGSVKGYVRRYSINDNESDSTAWITLKSAGHKFRWGKVRIGNRLEIRLNKNPIWNLDLKTGAVKSNFDLSNFKVKNFVLKTGATETKLKLGNKVKKSYINVKMGAARIKILVPRESGCKLISNTVLVEKDIKGFYETEKHVYKTRNYESSQNKVIIDVSGGVSSLEIDRY